MRALRGLALAALLGCAGFSACGGDDWDWKTPPVLDEAALLEHLRPQGEERLVVANFWATWWGTCLAEMPGLVELHRKVATRGVRVVAVSLDLPDPAQVRTAEELGALAKRRGFALPIVAFQGDLAALGARLKLPEGPPCTLLFDRDAHEVGRIEGEIEGDELQVLITRALTR